MKQKYFGLNIERENLKDNQTVEQVAKESYVVSKLVGLHDQTE